MIHDVSSPTTLMLDKSCHLSYSAGNVWVPMGRCTVSQLAERLDSYPVVDVEVTFNQSSNPKHHAQDLKTFTKRMASLPPRYQFTGFQPKVIDGHVQQTMAGRLTRSV